MAGCDGELCVMVNYCELQLGLMGDAELGVMMSWV